MKVINGNNIDILKQYPDNYFDAIVTDPPYGLGKEPNAEELMKDWIEKGYHEISGTGFMGKEWDAFIPQPIFWKEVFRVLKHGGHVLSFFGTRTYDWGVMSMRFAGFEVRDCIQWLYGSGFPKSHNISKAIDKMYGAEREVVGESAYTNMNIKGKDGFMVNDTEKRIRQQITEPSTDQAKQWDGWGSALKPANEPIVLARKPLEKGLTIAENVLKWGTGAINIDGCRVGNDIVKGQKAGQGFNNVKGFGVNTKLGSEEAKEYMSEDTNGRFPANLILTHHEDCECVGTKKVKAIKGGNSGTIGNEVYGKFNGEKNNDGCGFGDENGEETIEDWNCVDDCPIKILDEQSGESKSSNSKRNRNTIGSFGMPNDNTPEYSDKGGASRFFKQTNFEKNDFVRFQYQAKASKSERNKGLSNGMTNNHPTVKSLGIMRYLVRLITPPNGIVLDPFCGSGTTGVACKLEGFQFVGLEQDAEYCKIAQARIDNYVEEKTPIKKNVKIEVKPNQIDIFSNNL